MAFLGLYSVQVLAAPDGRGGVVLGATLAALYFVFIADYVARLYLADSRGKWFVRNLFDLVIVVFPFLRPLRLLSLVVVITALL
jgi:voltage-gated potassium channel